MEPLKPNDLSNNKRVIAIVGPTASGKTRLAIQLANHFNTEIISADSRQCYKEMNIGTAKPNQSELAAAKHHFIDSHSVENPLTAGQFEREASAILEDLFVSKNVVIVVGGSHLYVQALCEGLDDYPALDAETLADLRLKIEVTALKELQQELQNRDPEHFEAIDHQNKRRLQRAFEIMAATNNTVTNWKQQKQSSKSFETIYIGIQWPREALYNRINTRVDLMMKEGLLEEVKSLQGYADNCPALNTVGYQEFWPYLNGNIDLDEAVRLVKRNSRRYAKRQLTWVNNKMNTNWVSSNPTNQLSEAIDIIQNQQLD